MSAVGNEHKCDGCGADLQGGGVVNALIVSDIDEESGLVVNYEFCRTREEDGKKVKGCRDKLIRPQYLASFLERRVAERAAAKKEDEGNGKSKQASGKAGGRKRAREEGSA